MTVRVDPAEQIEVCLPQHDELPEAERPVFVFAGLRRRDRKRFMKLSGQLNDLADTQARLQGAGAEDLPKLVQELESSMSKIDEAMTGLEKLLLGLLLGWRNQRDNRGEAVPFDASTCGDEFDRLVDDRDLYQLFERLGSALAPGADDLKGSGSGSPLSKGSSAATVAEDATPEKTQAETTEAPSSSTAPSATTPRADASLVDTPGGSI